MCTHFGDPSHSTLAQGAKVSVQDPAVTRTKNVSPRQSGLLSCSKIRSLVLRDWRTESGTIPGTAEKHKKGLLVWLFPRTSPGSVSHTTAMPTACTQSFPILVNKDGLTKRKQGSSFFLLFFYAIMHLSLLSCHHRDGVAGSCRCLPLSSEAAIGDSA